MGRSNQTFSKREREKKKQKKREEKMRKKMEKRETESSSFDDMIAYVDEYGNIVDTPPDPQKKSKIKAEDIEVSIPPKEKEFFDPIRRGQVQFFNHDKGFGFIRDLDTQEEYFVHINETLEDIDQGNNVIFEIGNGPKGPMAVEVKLDK